MSALIRLANRTDAPPWIGLLRATMGNDYPAKEVYDLGWVANELAAGGERGTWLAELDGKFLASISILESVPGNHNPVANLGRCFFHPESFGNGLAKKLLERVLEEISKRSQIAVARVPLSDRPQQFLLETNGFHCVGFQPVKHLQPARQGILFYVRTNPPVLGARLPLSHSLAQVGELGSRVLMSMGMEPPLRIEDGATGYPLQSLVDITEEHAEHFEAHARDTLARQVPPEISTGYHRGNGVLRVTKSEAHAFLASQAGATSAGVLWVHDEQDRCVRIVDAFSTDDLSLGPLLFRVVALAQQRCNANYVEMDVLSTAPRLLKTAEQLGFIPMAYLPACNRQQGHHIDVVKLVKLNVPHSPEESPTHPNTVLITKTVEGYIEDQKAGVAVINLLRGLTMFNGLGDGELRKIARLFQQKLFRPGETIFSQGAAGDEAFIVLRGQVEILFDNPPRPVAMIEPGQIFGEQAFLDGSPRGASAAVQIPTILLVVQRRAFHELAQREPHLGLVVMRNIALELSSKLRRTNAVWVAEKKT